MPLDGIVSDCIVKELRETLINGRVDKIFQPENHDIVINIRAGGKNHKLLASANPGFPRIHLTQEQKSNPANAPLFCMLLRKHLGGGKITGFDFYDYERIITINIENLNELGDLCTKKLVIEIMGRHSNIILVNEKGNIVDSVRHVGSDISRVREVLPGRAYMLPPGQDKELPENIDPDTLFSDISIDTRIDRYLLEKIKGFSPYLGRRIVHKADIDKGPLTTENIISLKNVLYEVLLKIKNKEYSPYISFDDRMEEKPSDFHCIYLGESPADFNGSISKIMDMFYSSKAFSDKLNQHKTSISKIIDTHIARVSKKLAILETSIREVSDRETLKLYGDLLTAYIYSVPANARMVSLENYNDENLSLVQIPLDPNKTPQENAQKYYKKYAKAKSRYNHATIQINDALSELGYLESILHSLDSCKSISDTEEIRDELVQTGYLKKPSGKKQKSKPSGLSHESFIQYVTKSGHRVYVGKNNKQNDYLTFKFASQSDIWLHTRNIPGSHVIIKTQNREISDEDIEQASMLAAFHSKAGSSAKVPVDYTTVKYVKKPNGAKPGMVIYDFFKTMIVTPQKEIVDQLKYKAQ